MSVGDALQDIQPPASQPKRSKSEVAGEGRGGVREQLGFGPIARIVCGVVTHCGIASCPHLSLKEQKI